MSDRYARFNFRATLISSSGETPLNIFTTDYHLNPRITSLDSHKQLLGNLANKKTGRNAFAVDCSKAQQKSIPKEESIMNISEILDGISKKDQVLPEFQREYVWSKDQA